MMKKLLVLLLALLTVATLAACSNKEKDPDNMDDYKQKDIVYNSWPREGDSIFYFESIDSDSVTITGYKGPTEPHDIVIPQTVQLNDDAATSTRNVTAIADDAFYAVASIEKVVIPEGITSIGNYAFAKCAQLTTVVFPSTIETIGQGAFVDCGLTELNFPASCGLTKIEPSTFRNCMQLTEVTIPGYITTVGEGAFFNCQSITKIVISEGVELIEKQAFQDTRALEHLELPASLTNTDPMEDLAFSGSEVLYRENIICPEDSAAEAYADNMVLSPRPEGE